MTSANCGQSDEIDGIGQKKRRFYGRGEGRQKKRHPRKDVSVTIW